MYSTARKSICCLFLLPVMLVLLATAGSVAAQTGPEVDTAATGESTSEADKKAETDAQADLRDSVHENLDTFQQDVETASQITPGSSSEAPISEIESTGIPMAPEEESSEQPPERRSTIDFLKSIPIWLQAVPDRMPWIRERGLIFFGRTELDYAHYSSGITSKDSGFKLRSLRLGLAKGFKHNISTKAELDFTDGDSNFSDLYARYTNARYGVLTVGNQRVAQTLVNQTSRISRTFMEESLPGEAFGLGRRLALGWDLHKKKAGVHATLFGSDLNGSIGDSGYAGRAYFNPTRSRFNLFHVGGSFVSENMSRKTRFFSHPESRVTSVRFVDTDLFDDVTRQRIAGLEVAGAKDQFMFRSEFFRAKWDRKTAEDPVFKGYYVQANWVLTGESFRYTQGKFIRIRPENPRGAWEAAIRYSQINLNDARITGGEERNLTIALNWYAPDNQFRVMANLIFVDTDEFAGNEDPTIFQVRGQLHW